MKRIVSLDLVGKLKDGKSVLLSKAANHHLRKVLRLEAGAHVELCDGRGTTAIGTIMDNGNIKLANLTFQMPKKNLCVVLALIKSDRFRIAIEKLAELGVTEIRPLFTDRSQIKAPVNNVEKRIEKWNAILENATRQSGRFFVPKIYSPDSIENICKLDYEHIVADPKADHEGFLTTEKDAIWIGPEGGFSPKENVFMANFGKLYLSDGILRTETAATVAAALLLR